MTARPLAANLWPWLAAASSGVLIALCFPGWNQGGLCWIALTPLLCALWFSPEPKKRAWLKNAGLGFCTGVVFFGITFSWLTTVTNLMSPRIVGTLGLCGLDVLPRDLFRDVGLVRGQHRLRPAGRGQRHAELALQPVARRRLRRRVGRAGMAARLGLHRVWLEQSRRGFARRHPAHPDRGHHRRGGPLLPGRPVQRHRGRDRAAFHAGGPEPQTSPAFRFHAHDGAGGNRAWFTGFTHCMRGRAPPPRSAWRRSRRTSPRRKNSTAITRT